MSARPLHSMLTRLLNTTVLIALALLALAGPVGGFIVACAFEYLRAAGEGGDTTFTRGTVTAHDGRIDALMNPWGASTITHSLRESAADTLASARLIWELKDAPSAARWAGLWTLLPVSSVLLGLIVGRLVAQWCSTPRYWLVLRRDRAARRTIRRAGRGALFAGVAALPLAGYAGGLTHVVFGNSVFQYATGVPSWQDFAAMAVAASVIPFGWAAWRTVRAIQSTVESAHLRCLCEYPMPQPGLARCPECGRAAPSMPPEVLLLGARPATLVRVAAICALFLAALGALAGVDAAGVRGLARSVTYSRQTAAAGPVQLRAWWADPVVVHYADGVGLVLTERALKPSASPVLPGRQPAAMNGLAGRFSYATAFWPNSQSIGELKDASISVGTLSVRAEDGASVLVSIPCGPHIVDISCHESQLEFNQYTFRGRPAAVLRESSIGPLRGLLASLRERATEEAECP